MSTNYYWIKEYSELNYLEPTIHIGKRVSIGLWCFTCKVPLHNPLNGDLIRNCHICNSMFDFEKYKQSTPINTGIGFATKFIWTMGCHKDKIVQFYNSNNLDNIIINEYKNEINAKQFLEQELSLCLKEDISFKYFS